jgi:hypothetical protein
VVGFSGREQFNASASAAAENNPRKRAHADKIGLTDNIRGPLCVLVSSAV